MIKEIITDACLIVLPLDLLYLHFADAWTDPIQVILWAELIMLVAISIFGVYRFVIYLKQLQETME